jgi:hypothetical protein
MANPVQVVSVTDDIGCGHGPIRLGSVLPDLLRVLRMRQIPDQVVCLRNADNVYYVK